MSIIIVDNNSNVINRSDLVPSTGIEFSVSETKNIKKIKLTYADNSGSINFNGHVWINKDSKKEYDKLNKILCGIRNMDKLPQAMFIVDPSKEEIAIREARKLNIPVFGIVDTNCDPDMVDYVIPANDDAIRAVKLITGVMNNAIIEANGGHITDYSGKADENGTDIMKRAVESVKRKEEKRPFEKKNFKKSFNKVEKEVKENPKAKEAKADKTEEVEKVEKVETKKAEVKGDLSNLTVAELREMAKAKEVKGYSTMKKAELLEALK